MQLTLLKSKLHHLRVTDAQLEYAGSLSIDPDLLDAVGLLPFEKVLVANLANGERFETYAIEGERGSRVACLNGAAAYKGKTGDRLIVMAFCQMPETEARAHVPRVVQLDAGNRIVDTSR